MKRGCYENNNEDTSRFRGSMKRLILDERDEPKDKKTIVLEGR